MKIKKVSNPRLQIHGILLTKKNGRLNSAKSFEESLRAEGDVFTTTISRTNDIPNSQDRDFDDRPGICHDIFSYRRGRGHAIDEFIALANEYLKKWGK
jgi:cellulose biosynthesis protein BcsQ